MTHGDMPEAAKQRAGSFWKQIAVQAGWAVVSTALLAQAWASSWAGRVLFRRRRTQSRDIDLAQVKNLLIVRPDEIGDMVMCTPFLRELRRCAPSAHISLVVKPTVRSLVELCPYVDEVITYDQRVSLLWRPLLLPCRAFRLAARTLWQRRFDLAVLPRFETDNCFAVYVAFWSGAPVRIGYSETTNPHKRRVNRGFDRLLTHALPETEVKHDVELNLNVLRFLGGTVREERQELWLGAGDHVFAEETLGGKEGKIVAIGPAGGHSVLKQWPLENFAAVGRWLQEHYRARIVLVGGPGEEELGRALAQRLGPGVINLIGKTTLRQMAAVLGRSDAYVGNDSGPTHMAAAMGTPTVALFGSSCPHRFRPQGDCTIIWRELPCGPCQQGHPWDRCGTCLYDQPRCLLEITPEEVQRALANSLFPTNRRLAMAAPGAANKEFSDPATKRPG